VPEDTSPRESQKIDTGTGGQTGKAGRTTVSGRWEILTSKKRCDQEGHL